MDTAERIFLLLDQSGMEQKKFAELIGATDKIVSKWRTSGLKSYRKYLPQIADALGTSVEYLVTGEKKAPAGQEADGREKEFVQLFEKLTPEQQDLFIAQLRGVVDSQDK
ncbi:hypothetical protein [Intestinimonas timonensis]|uniref:hypothetical protein n=1 Tax=Intestinimonas timonensis TaxID=1689270 RepID=UPI00102F8F0E|nr:hypothetical protein [Intestinimonas timonensis]